MRVIYNKYIPFKNFIAINLFGYLFAREEYRPISDRTIRHESIHTMQMKELLYVPFYIVYVLEWFIKLFKYGKDAYRNISFEREAYKYQDVLSDRKKYGWLKLIF